MRNILNLTKKSKLRDKVLAFIIILATVPVLTFGALALYLLGTSYRGNVVDLEMQLIDQKIQEIEKFFASTQGIIEIRVGFTQTSEISLPEQQFLLEGLLEENNAFEEVSLINLAGYETAKKARFKGKIELVDVSRLPKFKIASGGSNFVSNVYHTLSGPMLTIAAPVYNRNNDIIQILAAEVNLSQITQTIQNARLGASGYLVLVDNNGFLIGNGNDLSFSKRIKRVLNGEMLDGLSPSDRYESFISQTVVIGAAKQMPVTGWGLLAEWPIEESEATIRSVRNQVILFTLFGVIAVLLLASVFVERLISPIRKLKFAAEAIQKGNFEKRVLIKTGDELEELGSAFNKMSIGLKRLEELRNEFVFIAAHELRAPVTVIKGYVSMILGGDAGNVSSKVKEMLDPVAKSSEGLNQLVENLLQVARSESGTIKIAVKPIDISKSIIDTLVEFKILAGKKSIKLVYDTKSKIPQVLADEDKLKEVLKNLIDNAIKYTLQASTITIGHKVQGKMLITYVQDCGIGMSEAEQKKLFKKFYRAKAKETRDIQGTGLGLWIIKQLIQKMNGKMFVTSQKSHGSTFSFSLPIAQ